MTPVAEFPILEERPAWEADGTLAALVADVAGGQPAAMLAAVDWLQEQAATLPQVLLWFTGVRGRTKGGDWNWLGERYLDAEARLLILAGWLHHTQEGLQVVPGAEWSRQGNQAEAVDWVLSSRPDRTLLGNAIHNSLWMNGMVLGHHIHPRTSEEFGACFQQRLEMPYHEIAAKDKPHGTRVMGVLLHAHKLMLVRSLAGFPFVSTRRKVLARNYRSNRVKAAPDWLWEARNAVRCVRPFPRLYTWEAKKSP